MKLGARTDGGTWANFYGVQFSFCVQGKTFLFGQNQLTYEWFISELLPDGTLGMQTDGGKWENAYGVQFSFEIKGRTFFLGQSLFTKKWFISELLPDGKLGKETDGGFWNYAWSIQFSFWVDNRLFFYGESPLLNGWFISELLPGGKLGQQTATGALSAGLKGSFSCQCGPNVYLFKRYLTSVDGESYELKTGGEMGGLAGYGHQGNAEIEIVQFPYSINGSQFCLSHFLGTGHWIIKKLLKGGQFGEATMAGAWGDAYKVLLPFKVRDRSFIERERHYVFGQSERTKSWFIQSLIGPDDLSGSGSPVDNGVTIYIWSFRGISEAWGHASMQVGDSGPYISWFPQDVTYKSMPLIPDIFVAPAIENQTFGNDVALENHHSPDMVIEIPYLLDVDKITSWWNEFKGNKSNHWSSLGQNCSTTVKDALVAGGAYKILTPREVGNWENVIVWTPYDVAAFASAIKAHQSGGAAGK